MSIKDRIFIFGGPGTLHDRLKFIILAPIFIVVGVTIRFMFIPTFEEIPLLNFIINISFPVGTVYIGLFLLDRID